MADKMHLTEGPQCNLFNDDRDQIKNVERLHRKALCRGYSNEPINKRKLKQYNGMTSEWEDT